MPYESLEERLKKANIRKQTLEQFIKKGGYTIASPPKEGESKWHGINEAAEATGLNRFTISRLLKEFPAPPEQKLKGKTVEQFEQSLAYTLFLEKYPTARGKGLLNYIKIAFENLKRDHKIMKDPLEWDYEEYRLIWKMPEFHEEKVKRPEAIEEHRATAFHNLMKLERKNEQTGKFETKAGLIPMFKGGKLPAGTKTQWWLSDTDIKECSERCQTVDILNFIYLGISFGARSSSLIHESFTPSQFLEEQLTVQMYEPKVKKNVNRFIHGKTLKFILQWFKDCNIKPDNQIFPQSYSYYNGLLGDIKLANKKLSTHILKHTFVTQAHNHGLSMETVEHQTGTEARTLKKYYTEPNEAAMKAEITGQHIEGKTFAEWIEDVHPYFEKAYNRIKAQAPAEQKNGMVKA